MARSTKNLRRLEFIEFRLAWHGRVRRADLQRQFSISPQQATNDLGEYAVRASENIDYDPRARTYVRRDGFEPILSLGSPNEYLMQLKMLADGFRSREEIWPEPVPAFEAIQTSTRQIAPRTLTMVLEAIEARSRLSAHYVSLSSDTEEMRHLVPHALANDGHRWHARAYDLDNERYSDFVLSRLDCVSLEKGDPSELPEDVGWTTMATIELQPEKGLKPRQRAQLEIEYEMKDGRLELSVRKAMLYYYLRHYGFDPRPVAGFTMRNQSSFHLEIANIEEVEGHLDRRA